MITIEQVATYLHLKNDGAGDPYLGGVVDAVNAYVESVPSKRVNIITDPDGNPLEVWTKDTEHAAIMLASRLYTRRNSPNGIETMNELGTSYVARYDPDIEKLLRIGVYNIPMVG